AARAPPVSDRAGCRQGARDVGGGDRRAPREPVRAAAWGRSQRTRTPPDAVGGDRLVVEPARRRRATRTPATGAVPRWVFARGGPRGPGRRRRRCGAGPG